MQTLGVSFVHFQALDFGLGRVTYFGQWHMSRTDHRPVPSLGLKDTCVFPVALFAGLPSPRIWSEEPTGLRRRRKRYTWSRAASAEPRPDQQNPS